MFYWKIHTRKIHTKLHPGLEWHIFHILFSEDIDDFTDIKLFTQIVLKFVGVLLKHLWVFLESLQQSSEIFRNFWKSSENVQEHLSGFLSNFRKSSKIFGKWSEILGKWSKTLSSVCLYNTKGSCKLHVDAGGED